MDRRDPMALSGSQSFYMQSGMAGSASGAQPGIQGSRGLRSITNPNIQYQPNAGGDPIGSFPVETSQALSPHGMNLGAPSAVPSGEPVKRKRGRPRKYGTDGPVSLALSPLSANNPGMVTSLNKRGRGRPPGSGKKQQLAALGEWLSGSAGMGFTPHIITIGVGEDIATKIMSFSQEGPRGICVLSANGAVSTVTLRQPSTSGGTVTYEGRFEIVCLSGSYLLSDSGSRNRSGGLTVSLASPDGRVIGGGVGGMLIAASPVQVILGSFLWGGSRSKNKRKEAAEGVIDSDNQTVENPSALNSVPLNQSLTPIGVWPTPQHVDMRNSHIDINLMRG